MMDDDELAQNCATEYSSLDLPQVGGEQYTTHLKICSMFQINQNHVYIALYQK